jgi:hypothetical protein
MGKLDEIATKYNTDKQSKNHNYTEFYEFWLENMKIDSLLEVGFGPGASARTWLEYLPEAKIYIMDNFGKEYHDVWHDPSVDIPGLNVVRGSSLDPETWLNVPYNLSCVIDDGDHTPTSQIQTFMLGFSKVAPGGIYVVEDLHCNFEPIYTDHDVFFPWLQQLILNQQCSAFKGTEGDFYKFRGLMSWPSRDIYSFHVYKSAVVFQKAK